MIRTGIMKILMWTIIPIALTLIFFVTVDYKHAEPWISLVFVWLAYLTASASCLLNSRSKQAILNYTLTLHAVIYFLIEVLAAVFFLYINNEIPHWSFTIQLLLFVAYVLLFGFEYIFNQKTRKQMSNLCHEKSVLDQWKLKVDLVKTISPSKEMMELSELLSVSPIEGKEETKNIEVEISSLMDHLPNGVNDVLKKLNERNRIIKTYNS